MSNPDPQLTFHGAAGTVTGSCYRVAHAGGQFLVDCGLFQGTKTIRELNYQPFPFDVSAIDFVLVTHAHIDHSGLIPKLHAAGYRGPVYCTEPTRDLLAFMLPDSGHIQEFEVERLNRRNERRGRKAVRPIYTKADAIACLDQVEVHSLNDWFAPGTGVRARLWNAGHILGAASIEVEVEAAETGGRPLRLLFSGDLGPEEKAFHQDPHAPRDVDYLVVESTYGDRDRDDLPPDRRRDILRREIVAAMKAGGNLIIPVFAVERTQELLYDIGELFREKAIPPAPVYLNSPLAIKATEVFEQHAGALHDVRQRGEVFYHHHFTFLHAADQSRQLEKIRSGAIIMAASGMCEAGRIRHHLKNNLWRSDATVLFVGYQAPGTLGQVIRDGAKSVRIQGDEVAVKARIRAIDTYSAHADQNELVDWVCERLPVSQTIFLTHGEPAAFDAFRRHLVDRGCRADAIAVPQLDETFSLRLEGAPAHTLTTPRVRSDQIGRTDWHNDYAAFILALSQTLQRIPDDERRRALLRELKDLIADADDRGAG